MLEIENEGKGAGAALTLMLEEFCQCQYFLLLFFCLFHHASAAILCFVAERSNQVEQE